MLVPDQTSVDICTAAQPRERMEEAVNENLVTGEKYDLAPHHSASAYAGRRLP
jgi:hypothetical protein